MTKRIVLDAVEQYYEGKPERLIDLFSIGFDLHDCPESKEIITLLLQGKKPRGKGHVQSRKIAERNRSIVAFVAQLNGAGFPIYGGNKKNKSACDIAAEVFGNERQLKKYTGNNFHEVDVFIQGDPYILRECAEPLARYTIYKNIWGAYQKEINDKEEELKSQGNQEVNPLEPNVSEELRELKDFIEANKSIGKNMDEHLIELYGGYK